eukprot:5470971-Pleurochrysis_carterae.AAC.2
MRDSSPCMERKAAQREKEHPRLEAEAAETRRGATRTARMWLPVLAFAITSTTCPKGSRQQTKDNGL